MNKREVISAVAERSGVNPEDCARVLDSFEDVFTDIRPAESYQRKEKQ